MHKEPKDCSNSKRRRRFRVTSSPEYIASRTKGQGKAAVPDSSTHKKQSKEVSGEIKPEKKYTQLYNLNTVHKTKNPYILTHTTALLTISHDYIITPHTTY